MKELARYIGDSFPDEVGDWVLHRADQGDVSVDGAWREAVGTFDRLELPTPPKLPRRAALCRAVLDGSIDYTTL